MEYEIRLATNEDIPQALDLAWRMFVKYDSQDYGAEHTEQTEFHYYLWTVSINAKE